MEDELATANERISELEGELSDSEDTVARLERELDEAQNNAQPQDHCEMLQKLIDYNCAFEDERHKVFFSLDDLRKFVEHPERWDMLKGTKLKNFGGNSYVRTEQGTEAGAAA